MASWGIPLLDDLRSEQGQYTAVGFRIYTPVVEDGLRAVEARVVTTVDHDGVGEVRIVSSFGVRESLPCPPELIFHFDVSGGIGPSLRHTNALR